MTFSTTIPSRVRTLSSPRIANGPSGPVPRADVVQENELLAGRPAGDGRTVDEFQPQIRVRGDEFGDLAGVRLASRAPVSGRPASSRRCPRRGCRRFVTHLGAAQKAAHISALNFGLGLCFGHGPRVGRGAQPVQLPARSSRAVICITCRRADIRSAAWPSKWR